MTIMDMASRTPASAAVIDRRHDHDRVSRAHGPTLAVTLHRLPLLYAVNSRLQLRSPSSR